uniref:Uncharacterized protein n=1 Tax=Timema tahoe TaxID=61484 RepID=A0A7R9FIR4_9NEOP|nr:unnamed protein product [Timema tahoe]
MTSNAIRGIRRKKSTLSEVKVAVVGAPAVGKSVLKIDLVMTQKIALLMTNRHAAITVLTLLLRYRHAAITVLTLLLRYRHAVNHSVDSSAPLPPRYNHRVDSSAPLPPRYDHRVDYSALLPPRCNHRVDSSSPLPQRSNGHRKTACVNPHLQLVSWVRILPLLRRQTKTRRGRCVSARAVNHQSTQEKFVAVADVRKTSKDHTYGMSSVCSNRSSYPHSQDVLCLFLQGLSPMKCQET